MSQRETQVYAFDWPEGKLFVLHMVYPPDHCPEATGHQGICEAGGWSATLRGGNGPYGTWLPTAEGPRAVRPARP